MRRLDGYFDIPSAKRPVDLWINIETPYMPITTTGKQPDITMFIDAIQEAGTQAIKRAKSKARVPRDKQQYQNRVIINNLEAGAALAGGNGEHRYSQRQLFYAIRGPFAQVFGQDPAWKFFCKVLTDYEASDGDIPGMTRDPRGIIYHPHIGQEIPLGTIYVEKYRRPEWLFSKVLYCEKEGFFPILRALKWPERNDCALMTSKGFATRAARDLIDYLAKTDEECTFFCIHDADASGTMIYQSLQEETKARGARKVKIINLGLEPAEGRAMGLQDENVEKDDRKSELAVAEYVPETDKRWLQRKRIELNAMTTPQFLEWLDRKFEPYCAAR